MDHVADSLQQAFDALLNTMSVVLEAKEASDAQRTARTDTALEQFYTAFQIFQATCDQAQEFVDSARQRIELEIGSEIASECIADEATGPISQKLSEIAEEGLNKSAIPPLSATRLEKISKAVQLLVLELQPGSGTAAPPAPDRTPTEDSSQ